jgi:hypothetical protein
MNVLSGAGAAEAERAAEALVDLFINGIARRPQQA